MTFSKPKYDILGIGHAILDVFVDIEDDSELMRRDLIKGTMKLVHQDHAFMLGLGSTKQAPGGSVANSLAVAASIGARTAMIGILGDDQEAKLFRDGMQKSNVDMLVREANPDYPTAKSIIHVSPDAERTMATNLGAAQQFQPEHLLLPAIMDTNFIFFDGYMLDNPRTRQFMFAMILQSLLSPYKPKIAISLGDTGCARRNADIIKAMQNTSPSHVDIIFANEKEINAFVTGNDEPDPRNGLVFVTRGAQGAAVYSENRTLFSPAAPIAKLVDTTGAGDAFAGGVLYGLSHNFTPYEAMRIGGAAAAEIIQQKGARPEQSFRHLVNAA